jgi:stage II sporulation protein D
MLRRSCPILLALVLASGAAAAPPPEQATLRFLVSGHGWGHGVGMSQYGAYGYAQRGFTYQQILAHYYPGTALGSASVKSVRVLLGSAGVVHIASTAPMTLRDGGGKTYALSAGDRSLGPALKVKLPDGAKPESLPGPLTFSSAGAPLEFKRPYRGSFVLSTDGKKVTVVNVVGLDQYLYGVVPSEMPFTWHPEALKAQAVAARSYALAVRKTGGTFDLYSDTRSQVYRGLIGEQLSSNAAVDATAGQVLLYEGKTAITYFYSTSGGRTAAIADVWKSDPVPYLVSVSDPYDAISPYHNWGPLLFPAVKLQKVFKVPGKLLDVQVQLNPSGRVATATLTGDQGEVTASGADLRAKLKLRSTWFRVGVLALDPLPAKAVLYGTKVRLTGLGRGLSDLALEWRAAGATVWQPVGAVKAQPDGTVAAGVKAAAPGDYRLTSGGVASDLAALLVRPMVRLQVPTAPTALGGIVRPAIAGATVALQRANSAGGWTTVARTPLADGGTFSAAFDVAAGTYRARVAPGKGWAVGLSPELQVDRT